MPKIPNVSPKELMREDGSPMLDEEKVIKKGNVLVSENLEPLIDVKLFLTGFVQVLFVAMSTVFISKRIWIGVAVSGFCISYLWSHNVKKVAFGREIDRITYAAGAMVGSLTGCYCASFVAELLK